MVRGSDTLIGVLEGAEKDVVGLVENLIRKDKVYAVRILSEVPIETRVWRQWHTQFEVLEDVPQADSLNLAGLAQNVMDAVEADQG